MARIRITVKVETPFENDVVREFFRWAEAKSVNEVANRLRDLCDEYPTPEESP